MILPWQIRKIEDRLTRWSLYGVWVIFGVSVLGWIVPYPSWVLGLCVLAWLPLCAVVTFRLMRESKRDMRRSKAFLDACAYASEHPEVTDLDSLLSAEHQEDMRVFRAQRMLRDKDQ